MRRNLIIACLVIIAIAALAAAATHLSDEVQVASPPEINGVTPTATPAPTQIPTPPAR